MRVLVDAIGSYGDVLPYVVLADRLQRAGLDVTVATHAPYRDLVEAYGVGFAALPMDPQAELTPEVAREIRRGPVAAARALDRVFGPWVPQICTAMDDLADDADVVVHSTMAWPAVHSALARDLPVVGVPLQPLEPTAAFAPPAMTTRSFGALGNRVLGRMLQRRMVTPYLDAVNAIRRRHGLGEVTADGHLALLRERKVPVCHAFSRHLVPRPADWRPEAEVIGALTARPPAGWSPPATLAAFVAAGPAPVFVGFGSTVPAEPARLDRMVTEVAEGSGLRLVVQRGWAGLDVEHELVHVVDEVPHDWLFPRVRAVVHHAGAGTAHAALLAGVPSVTVPVSVDQPFWARRLHETGAAARPVPARRLDGRRLLEALEQVTRDPGPAARARELSAAMSGEDAAAALGRRIARASGV